MSRRGEAMQARASYEDVAMFAFEMSEAWRRHSSSGKATAAKAAEREFERACAEVRLLGERLRQTPA